MAETLIDTLLALQSRDADAIRIRGEMDGIRRERSAREEVLKRYETDVASLRDEQIRIKKEIDACELELREFDESGRKLKVKLNSAKISNVEYQAFNREIAGKTADRGLVEDRMLEKMEALDAVARRMTEAQAGEAEARNAFEAYRRETESRLEAMTGELSRIAGDRKAYAATVDQTALDLYERVLGRVNGSVLVEANPERNTCGGCFMQIPPQTINLLFNPQKLVTCTTCSRILFLADKTRQRLRESW